MLEALLTAVLVAAILTLAPIAAYAYLLIAAPFLGERKAEHGLGLLNDVLLIVVAAAIGLGLLTLLAATV